MIKCCLNWQRNKRLGIKNWYACTNSLLGHFSRIDSPDWQFNFYYRSSTQWWVENSRWSSQSLLWEYSLWSCFFGIKEPDRKWNFFFRLREQRRHRAGAWSNDLFRVRQWPLGSCQWRLLIGFSVLFARTKRVQKFAPIQCSKIFRFTVQSVGGKPSSM